MTTPILDLDLPPEHPLRQILDFIAAHPEVRQPVLRALLTEDFLGLPVQVQELRTDLNDFKDETRGQFRVVNERLDENTRRIDENTQRLDGIDGRLDGIDGRLDGIDGRLDGIDGRLDENTQRLDAVTKRLDENTRVLTDNTVSTRRLEGHVGRMRGLSYEDSCRYYIGVILDGYLDGPILADRERINEQLRKARRNNIISREEYEHGLSPDIIARAEDDTAQADQLAVVEASITFNKRDVENAARRAAIIARVTGVRTVAYVATHYPWPDEMDTVAQQFGVTIIRKESEEHASDC